MVAIRTANRNEQEGSSLRVLWASGGSRTPKKTTAGILSSSEEAGVGWGGKNIHSLGAKRWDRMWSKVWEFGVSSRDSVTTQGRQQLAQKPGCGHG